MRARNRLRLKALLAALGTSGMALVLTLLFYDGPMHVPQVLLSAEANNHPTLQVGLAASIPVVADTPPFSLPTSSQPLAWQELSLDGDAIHLNVLQTPMQLAQTTQKSGSEAFDYAAYLFEQAAQGVKESQLAAQLSDLKLQAQLMGNALRQAGEMHYDGAPLEDMSHLRVRSAILTHLQTLNQGALVTAHYNQTGKLLTEEQGKPEAGQALQRFQTQLEQVLKDPSAQRYPQTMALLQKESNLMAQLAQNLRLRWETTQYCANQCRSSQTEVPLVTHMRIYTQQTLPENTLVSATL